ncbi:MAG: elongation factor P [Myxococcales bacterium]|nr:elongation factor P [Myxococcales bacterium]
MATIYTATNIRVGHIIEFENEPYKVLAATHITPGKGNAVMQVKMRGIKSGVQREQRYRSVENVKRITLDMVKMEFLYEDGEMAHFMNAETFEQVSYGIGLIENELHFMLPNSHVQMLFYGTDLVGIELPKIVELKVIETAPYIKGATVTNQSKPAKLETGLEVGVPGFIEVGEVVRVDTETGEYIERAR